MSKGTKFNLNLVLLTVVLIGITAGLIIMIVAKHEPTYGGKTASYWLKTVKPLQQTSELEALQKLGKKAVPTLQLALKDPLPNDRYKAVWTMGQLGSNACDAVDDLIPKLEDSNPTVRYYAIKSIGLIDPMKKEIFSALVRKLSDQNYSVDLAAADLLDEIVKKQKENNLPLYYQNQAEYAVEFVKSPSPSVQINGIFKLEEIPELDAEVINEVYKLLEHTNATVQKTAKMFIDERVLSTNQTANPK